MTPSSSYKYLALCVLVTVMVKVIAQDYSLEENIREVLARRKSMDSVRQILEDMDNSLKRLKKRNCNFHAGMNDACETKSLGSNLVEEFHWNDEDNAPGKRKKSVDGASKDGVRRLLKSMFLSRKQR